MSVVTFGKFIQYPWKPLLTIECSECSKKVEVGGYIEDYLYKSSDVNPIFRAMKQREIGYCGVTKKFLCLSCDIVYQCEVCSGTVRKQKLLPGGKCTQCLHTINPKRKKRCVCSAHRSFSEKYTRLYHCSLCSNTVCNLDSVPVKGGQWILCLSCLFRPTRHGIYFDNEAFQRASFEIECGAENTQFEAEVEEMRSRATNIITDAALYIEALEKHRNL